MWLWVWVCGEAWMWVWLWVWLRVGVGVWVGVGVGGKRRWGPLELLPSPQPCYWLQGAVPREARAGWVWVWGEAWVGGPVAEKGSDRGERDGL